MIFLFYIERVPFLKAIFYQKFYHCFTCGFKILRTASNYFQRLKKKKQLKRSVPTIFKQANRVKTFSHNLEGLFKHFKSSAQLSPVYRIATKSVTRKPFYR